MTVRSRLPVSAAEAFAWHTRPGAFERLAPPWSPPEIVERSAGIGDGARVTLELPLAGLKLRWTLEHFGYQEGREFRDRQVEGPFASWEHVHGFRPEGAEASVLEDRISFEPPAAGLGAGALRERLVRVFAFRHRRLARDLARHLRVRGRGPQTVAVTGASGFLGRALTQLLATGGHRVVRLLRRRGPEGRPGDVFWDPDAGVIEAAGLEGVDAVVHLAGESVSGGRWSEERKRRIRDSRVQGTALLARTLAGLARPPRVLVSASGVNVYGDRGDQPTDETTPAGQGFLAEVVTAWEQAAAPARDRGIRVAHPRMGAVLAPHGGALARMLPFFRAGLGGRVGSGRQFMSWIDLDDAVGAIHHALFDEQLSGPFNVTAPSPVSNATFATTLARVLGRPAVLPVPGFALRAAFGEMGQELLLTGARVLPARLLRAGFPFVQPELEPALAEMLGRGPLPPTGGSEGEQRIELAL
jgi:uncharacterized protein (TIGR01777 family)